jgi:hypothetical protein
MFNIKAKGNIRDCVYWVDNTKAKSNKGYKGWVYNIKAKE